ncbi:hypothetical protein [Rhodanobacter sp. PCA2]|uniref:hypothetical protein n=1 Tax=Rhodanobacter sp. PCA2 TaxID=2006117 RepID=UPI0015E769A4|nr:hypothetical protein [Rhodanobacter sp. PCA2]
MRMKVHLSFLAVMSVLSLCSCGHGEPGKSTQAVMCGKFSFRASGRSEILQARRAFHEASIVLNLDFSDSSNTSSDQRPGWSWTHAEIKINSARIVLGGHGDYPKTPDPPSDMQVYLFDDSPPNVVACGSYYVNQFRKVKAIMSERWHISEDES